MARHFTNSSSNKWAQTTGSTGPAAGLSTYTICGWMKWAAAQASCLYSEGEPAGNNYVSCGMDSGGRAIHDAKAPSGGTATTAQSSTTISTGSWGHICAIKNSGSSRDVYLNGGGKGTSTTSLGGQSTTNSQIGLLTLGSNFSPCNGDIAEVAIWNVALTAGEALALGSGASPLTIRPASLIRYWPFLGINSPEPNPLGTTTMTLTGTSIQANHPPIFYPKRRPIGIYFPAVSTSGAKRVGMGGGRAGGGGLRAGFGAYRVA
jgi:hypothetical protein